MADIESTGKSQNTHKSEQHKTVIYVFFNKVNDANGSGEEL